jgi:hypothetical protein
VRNPGGWLWQVLVFVLRIPFRPLEATGFSIAKIEDRCGRGCSRYSKSSRSGTSPRVGAWEATVSP